ncbi:hypothetical protein RCL1_002687 [Eukaryota sp. TZLM3-RCL]
MPKLHLVSNNIAIVLAEHPEELHFDHLYVYLVVDASVVLGMEATSLFCSKVYIVDANSLLIPLLDLPTSKEFRVFCKHCAHNYVGNASRNRQHFLNQKGVRG